MALPGFKMPLNSGHISCYEAHPSSENDFKDFISLIYVFQNEEICFWKKTIAFFNNLSPPAFMWKPPKNVMTNFYVKYLE